MSLAHIAGLLALYAAGALAACQFPTINYFPKADELQVGFAVNVTTGYAGNQSIIEVCNGTQNCNFPVWKSTSQAAAATQANVNLDAGLLMVVLPTDRDATLYFKVNSPLLVESNTTLIDDCLAPVVTRKLLVSSVMNVTVTKAGTIQYTIKVDSGNTSAGEVIGTSGGKLFVAKEDYKGEHCAEITATITGYELQDSTGNVTAQLLANALSVTSKKICWYKPTANMATAEVEIATPTMCDVTLADDQQKINVTVSSVTPSYLPLMQHTTDLPFPLLRPVVQVFGRRVAALDGTPDTELYDATANNKNFVNQYILFPENFTATSVWPVALNSVELEEGFYNITAKVFVMSNFPELLGFPSTPIAQTEVDAVKGQVEIMTQDLFKNQKLALQKSLTTLSAINSDKEGKTIAANDDIEFSWTFVGAPSAQTCTHGSEAPKTCTSPYTVKAKDVTGAAKVPFVVTFTDVCGNKKEAEYEYSAAGVTALTKIDTTVGSGSVITPVKSAASAAVPVGAVATVVIGLLMAAFL